jgi:hypothetical protein
MPDKMTPESLAADGDDNDSFPLTVREKRFISNYRAMRVTAQEMLFNLSEQYRYTLPANQAASG